MKLTKEELVLLYQILDQTAVRGHEQKQLIVNLMAKLAAMATEGEDD